MTNRSVRIYAYMGSAAAEVAAGAVTLAARHIIRAPARPYQDFLKNAQLSVMNDPEIAAADAGHTCQRAGLTRAQQHSPGSRRP